jgi:hypothetical protein
MSHTRSGRNALLSTPSFRRGVCVPISRQRIVQNRLASWARHPVQLADFFAIIDPQDASNSYRRLPLEAHSQCGKAQRCGLSCARLSADNATNMKAGGWPPPLPYCPMENFPGEIGDDGQVLASLGGPTPALRLSLLLPHRRSFGYDAGDGWRTNTKYFLAMMNAAARSRLYS